nr:hypothetical protein [Tanacetum cinerariifolium]
VPVAPTAAPVPAQPENLMDIAEDYEGAHSPINEQPPVTPARQTALRVNTSPFDDPNDHSESIAARTMEPISATARSPPPLPSTNGAVARAPSTDR